MSTESSGRIDWDSAKRSLQIAETALEKAMFVDQERIHRVYEERAIQLAKRRTVKAGAMRTTNVLVFSLAPETYGIAISDLAEVLPATKYTPVPRAAAEILGLINLRGELRTVIDLRLLLGLPAAKYDASGRILMLKNGHDVVGLKVGQVDKVQAIREDDLASPESGAADSSAGYFRGLSPDKIIILNAAALLSHPVFGTSSP